jgi:hypothetical protein
MFNSKKLGIMTMPIVLTEAQWANSQLSVARYFGGCKFNGVQYVILNKEGKDIIIGTNREIDEIAMYTVTE